MSKNTIESMNSGRHSTYPTKTTLRPPPFSTKGFTFLTPTDNELTSPSHHHDWTSGLKHDKITSGFHTNFAIPDPISPMPRGLL
jgi:hypothetical protein